MRKALLILLTYIIEEKKSSEFLRKCFVVTFYIEVHKIEKKPSSLFAEGLLEDWLPALAHGNRLPGDLPVTLKTP